MDNIYGTPTLNRKGEKGEFSHVLPILPIDLFLSIKYLYFTILKVENHFLLIKMFAPV